MGEKSDGYAFFFVFSRFFVRFLTTSSKKFEKTTMKQKIQIRRLYKAKHFPRIFLFFESFWFLTKSGKTLEKTKKHKKKRID